MKDSIVLKPCMIFQEKHGTEFLYIESVSAKEIIMTVIDRQCDYQCEEHIKNDDQLQEILQGFELLN